MNTEVMTPETVQDVSEGVVLQQEKEGDSSTHLIAGLVAAEFGVTLTANWLFSASVTSTTASLGYIGIAVLAWGTVSVLNSVPALLASGEATEEGFTNRLEQNGVGPEHSKERNTEQGTTVAIGPSEIAQTDTDNTVPVFHAESSLLTASVHTTAP